MKTLTQRGRRAIAPVLLQAALALSANADTTDLDQVLAAATTLAKSDHTGALEGALFLCQDFAAASRHIMSFEKSLPATRVFDNLYFVGTEFVGVWILNTSEGYILFDAMGNSVEAAKHIVGGFSALGLDPNRIRYVVVTHGHWDHFGGARYLQARFGAKVLMGKADWQLLDQLDEQGPELMGQRPPTVDFAVSGPVDLTLGDTKVYLMATPGHSPGTVSALIPVRDGGASHQLALWGGTAIPPTLEPSRPDSDHSWRHQGLTQYRESLHSFRQWAVSRGADGVISTHPFSENTSGRLARVAARQPGDAHPFVIGGKGVDRYFMVIDYCAQALKIRTGQGEVR